MKHDIKICVPYYNIIEEDTQQAIYDLLDSEEINCAYMTIQGTNIANARNIMVNDGKSDMKYQTIDSEYTHILFLDADVVPTVDDIKTLLEYDVDVVSASYQSREQGYSLVGGLFKYDDNGDFTNALKLKSDSEGLMEVDWVGGGCILIKTKVFEQVSFPWFHYPVVSIERNGNIHQKLVYEDVGFCMNLKEHGVKIYMDCDTRVKHLARNYNSNIVTDRETLFKNINDDMNKMFQLIRGMSYDMAAMEEELDKYRN